MIYIILILLAWLIVFRYLPTNSQVTSRLQQLKLIRIAVYWLSTALCQAVERLFSAGNMICQGPLLSITICKVAFLTSLNSISYNMYLSKYFNGLIQFTVPQNGSILWYSCEGPLVVRPLHVERVVFKPLIVGIPDIPVAA